jgi:catechol 2,3-dioxygenase-like lactoylglutathione lyase family enzyme
MYDHIGLRVRDLDRVIGFYTAVLAPLGSELGFQDGASAGFGPPGAPVLWLYANEAAVGGTHVAFRAKSRRAVDRFHAAGLEAGGRDGGAPGVRADYAPNYYAAFLIDPNGNNVEAVCYT